MPSPQMQSARIKDHAACFAIAAPEDQYARYSWLKPSRSFKQKEFPCTPRMPPETQPETIFGGLGSLLLFMDNREPDKAYFSQRSRFVRRATKLV